MTPSQPRAARNPRDHYVTPYAVILPAVTEVLMGLLHDDRVRPRWLDPGAGTGIISHTIRELSSVVPLFLTSHITAVESDRTYRSNLTRMSGADSIEMRDFTKYGEDADEAIEPFDAIIGNPPYSLLMPFLRRAHALLAPEGYMAMLLNMHAVGTRGRAEWWREHKPAAVRPIAPRPSFTGGGTDQTEYAWFLWRGAPLRGRRVLRIDPYVLPERAVTPVPPRQKRGRP